MSSQEDRSLMNGRPRQPDISLDEPAVMAKVPMIAWCTAILEAAG